MFASDLKPEAEMTGFANSLIPGARRLLKDHDPGEMERPNIDTPSVSEALTSI